MVKINEDKRKLKAERVKQFFAETAKEMIIKEGISSISVRKVADLAVYSYATMYNHFKNLDELLWYTRNIMIRDIAEYLKEYKRTEIRDAESIKKLFKTYVDYFIKYPNVFEFFFFHHLEKSGKKVINIAKEMNFDEMFRATFEYYVLSGKFSGKELEIIIKTIVFSVHGMLMIYISNKDDMTKEDIYKSLDDMIGYLFR
jgi:AcrR family transcriptional regulator